ncbi:hypothetical protein CZ774_15035 [Frigoribacterium sp. JB110]|nr:hypothetical protein CZ774_15035 [Frigoribacterium sp. JB110]
MTTAAQTTDRAVVRAYQNRSRVPAHGIGTIVFAKARSVGECASSYSG